MPLSIGDRYSRAARSAGVANARRLAKVGGLAVAVALLGCSRPTAAPERPLRIALDSAPFNLDPHRCDVPSLSVLRNVYDALTAVAKDSRVGPALAESWENPSQLSWIFNLRRGVHFHDGHELTARDVVFSLDRARRDATSEIRSYLLAIDQVEAADRYVVKVTTRRPYPILLIKLAYVYIVPDGSPAEIRQPIGTGPYRIAPNQPPDRLALLAFDGSWSGVPTERRVEFLPLPDHEARLAGLLAGNFDIIEGPELNDLERIGRTPGCKLTKQPSLGVTYLALRADRPPLSDIRLRRAISLALDRRALVRSARRDVSTPLGQMVPRQVFGFAPDLEAPAAAPDEARGLLMAAGRAQGFGLTVEIRPGGNAQFAAVAGQLAAVGIHTHTVERPVELMVGQADALVADWYSLSGDASDFLDALAHSPTPDGGYGTGSVLGYHNPRLDELIEQSDATTDPRTRRATLEQAMHLCIADYAYLPLYSDPLIYGVRSTIDWQPRSDDLILASTIHRQATPNSAR